MSANGISTLPTKEDRQLAKLQLAETKRQAVGTAGYHQRRYLDITLLPTVYSGNDVVDNPNVGGLVIGRPWKTTPNVVSGLWRTTYNGYFANDLTWFDNQFPIESVAVTDFTLYDGDIFSSQWLGYFRAPHTADYTFYLESDDRAQFWIGNKAITGYDDGNWDVYSNPGEGERSSDPISLTAGHYYPIRLQYGNAGGPKFLNFSWSDNYSTNPSITIPDLALVTSGPVSGNAYIGNGGYSYAVFGNAATLTSAIISFYNIIPDNNGFFHPYPVTWSAGSDSINGYVYLQVTSTSDFQFYACDVDGNPIVATCVFPMRFEAL